MLKTRTSVKSAVLLGYGSIGKYHAKLLNERYPKLAIVDISETARDQAIIDYPEAEVVGYLSELIEIGWQWQDTLGVIANWGPDHARVFDELARLGIKHAVCEKPLAHSVEAGAGIVSTAAELGIVLGVHQPYRYSGLADGIRTLADDLGIGEPGNMVIQGGALGLVTNGIHFVDIGCDLFGTNPVSVISSAWGENINPRSPELEYYDGTAIWSLPDRREITLTLSNLSSVSFTISIYYRNAVVILDAKMDVEVWGRDAAQLEAFPAVTRFGQAVELMYKGAIPGINSREDRTRALLDEIESNDVRVLTPESALTALGACIGALSSGQRGCRVDLPIDPQSDIGRQEWPIS